MNLCSPEIFGADPARIKWNIVRGDTSPLRVEFLENDEVTYFDTSTWTFEATTYDPQADALDLLEVTAGDGYVDIMAPSPEAPSMTMALEKYIAKINKDK